MAATLIAERLSFDEDNNGKRGVKVYRVPNADLSGADEETRYDSALSAAGLPALGDTWHATLNTDMVCVSRRIENRVGTLADVECVFETPRTDADNPLLDSTGVPRFRGSLITEETWLDKDGNYMAVTYSGDMSDFFPDGFGTSGQFVNNKYLAQAEVFRPVFSFELARRFAFSSFATVKGHARDYIGHVNTSSWSGFAARTVLCSDVEVDLVNADELRVTYAFEYRAESWDFVATFKHFGRAPENINDPPGNGVGTFEVHPSREFGPLPVSM